MQEDFGFLNVNNCYSEKATISTPNQVEIDLEPTNSPSYNKNSLQAPKVKLEDSPEVNKWPFNYGINFLRTSDDPMISSVNQEIDHHENELLQTDSTSTNTPTTPQSPAFDTVTSRQINKTNFQLNQMTESIATQTVKTQRSSTRTRRKGPMKLRFHHQALPPEYLSHFESQQNIFHKQETPKVQLTQTPAKKKPQTKTVSLALPPVAEKTNTDAKMSNESIINWLQNILELQNNDESKAVPKIRNIPIEVAPTSSRTQCLKDLPYMGEMTLENMKPRRGRKPKKADICHLIYKNYGTIVPGSTASTTTSVTPSTNVKKSIESIKRKSMMTLKKSEESNASLKVKPTLVTNRKVAQNEPLNLCIREGKSKTEESLIIISDDNEESNSPLMRCKAMIEPCESDSIDLEFSSTIPSLLSPLDLSGDLPATSKDFFNTSTVTPPLSSSTSTPTTPSVSGAPPGYIYWPSAGIFIHPMALYYHKMMDGKINQDSSTSSSTSSLSSILNSEVNALWEQNMQSCGLDLKNPDFDMENISHLIKNENLIHSPPPALSELLKNTSLDPKKPSQPLNVQSQKRKRSAIFIPPVQTETSSTNPTNEVSICKFKFTGGAKPSLQEKKILSVDAGGNFRYFSGTGDKSMRGYEFFPRESLRQSSLASGSHTNAFLNATSEKIPLDLLPTISVGLNNKLLNLTTDIDTTKILDSNYALETENSLKVEKIEDRLNRKKKSSNRSIQRAKLEKTFKEKGFLIQTQQLQSAEGATYCKFRQLRKFTRYLFRSWKDYLPTDDNSTRPVDGPPTSSP